LQSRGSTTWHTPPIHFSLLILEMWSLKHIDQNGLDTWSFRSQFP
jgi:hypothetical protein